MQPRVLVVEDDASMAENLASIAQTLPAHVEVAASGRQALERAAAAPFLLVLLDVELPDGRGIDLIPSLRALSDTAQIVLITGHASVDSAAAAVNAAAFAYLVKPFQSAQIVEVLRRALDAATGLSQRKTEAAHIERSERIHRHLVDGMPAPTMAVDTDGQVSVWNRRIEALTGFSRDEVIGTRADGLVPRRQFDRLPVKAGPERLMRWERAALDIPAEGQWTCAVGSDPAEEREAFRQMARAERLAAVRHLSAGLAHEIRNPLNSARLQLAVLRRHATRGAIAGSEVVSAAETVDQEIERVDRLLSEFLAMIAPAARRMEPFSPAEVCREVLAGVRAPEVVSTLEVEAKPQTIVADRAAIQEVLNHLIRNGVDAMGGTGRLVVRVRGVGTRAEIDVEDTGSGFPDGAPIFDAFYSTKPQGTGLGLSIVHRIVEDHHGTVSVRSRPGLTCFTVSLPA
jgi:signal transduction histidine kinase